MTMVVALKLGVFVYNEIVSDNTLPVMKPNKAYLIIYQLLPTLLMMYLLHSGIVDAIYGSKQP